jgi:acyl-CoA reductase-like NAD-dependent aldehyde dehydrogenase
MAHVTCTSPIDGHVYVQRPFTGADELAQKLQRAKAAQRGWQQRSIQERAALCSQMVDAMLAMRSEIIPE